MFYDLQGVLLVLLLFFILAYIMIKIADIFDKKEFSKMKGKNRCFNCGSWNTYFTTHWNCRKCKAQWSGR